MADRMASRLRQIAGSFDDPIGCICRSAAQRIDELERQLAQERQLSDDLADSIEFARARLQDAASALTIGIQGHGAHRAG